MTLRKNLIMISIDSVIKRLREESKKAAHDQYIMACAIFNKKSIISIGVNKALSWKKDVPSKFKKWPTSIHAEVDAIHKARKKNLKGCSLLVVRFLKDGNLAMAKPCNFCMSYINYVEISNICYSNDKGLIEEIKL